MDSHLLFELAYVLYRIRSSIIHDEYWLMETLGKFCLFYSPSEGWFRNLAKSFHHNISSYSFARWAPTLSFMKMFLLTGKRFTRRSSWSLSVDCILFVIRRNIWAGRGLFPLCSTKLPLYIINFTLHGFFITLLMHCTTFSSITTSTCVERLQAAFLIVVQILFTLKIVKFILLMNIGWFCMVRTSLVWSWSRHDRYTPLKH